jgi:hypothetical protein
MPLPTVSFATYLTNIDVRWRDDDFNALKFVKAIKGLPVIKFALVPVCGTVRRLEQHNAEQAIDWYGEMASAYIRNRNPQPPLIFVPIPNSSCAVTNENVPRTLRLAGALAARLESATVSDILLWKEVMLPSSRGGTRNPEILYDNLVLTTQPPTTQVILIDDVRTTGAHLIAAAAKLAEASTPSSLAICAARTVLNQNETPFSLLEENLADFVPPQR